MSEELLGPEARALRGEPARDPAYLESQDGRRWHRVVFGRSGICAAETDTDELWVWDQAELFEALFRDAEDRRSAEPTGVDWRSMFMRYADWVGHCEGIDFLYPPGATHYGGDSPWTAEEWAAITAAAEASGQTTDG